jgi:putative transposase
MSEHVFSEIYLHITWHTKDDAPMLTPAVEAVAWEEIQRKCERVQEVYYHGVGGTATHVHLVVSLEPSVLISDCVGKVKGASSFHTNKRMGEGTLMWQPGYGIVSFRKNELAWVLEYVAKQKEHHASGQTSTILETIPERR